MSSSKPSTSLRQLSNDRGVSIPVLRRELSNEGRKLALRALSVNEESDPKAVGVRVGDYVQAPYEGELYLAEVVRIMNQTTAKICFVEYDEYAERPLKSLRLDATSKTTKAPHYNGNDFDDDFAASMRVGGGGGGGGGTMYSAKHVRAKMELSANGGRSKKATKGPVSTIAKNKKLAK
jgi:hypothetical protein